MNGTREQLIACIIVIITVLFFTTAGYGQVDPGSVVAFWLFDEGSGSVAADNSGHGYDADLKENSTWAAGQFGTAIEFDGSSYLEIRNSAANLAFGGAAPFTVTAWVKNQGGGTVIGKFNGGVVTDCYSQQRRRAFGNRHQIGLAIKIQAAEYAEAIAQRGGKQTHPGRCADQGKALQLKAVTAGMHAFIENKIDGKVFHRRIEEFLHSLGDAMNFIDKNDISAFKVGQQPDQIAAFFQGRPRGNG